MKKEEAAWVAGLFDGEGCVQFRSNHGCLLITLRLGMTHKPTMDRVHDLFDHAGITPNWTEQELPSGKIVYTVYFSKFEKVRQVCKVLLTYSTTKKDELEAAVVAIEMVEAQRHGPDRREAHRAALTHMRRCIPPRYRLSVNPQERQNQWT